MTRRSPPEVSVILPAFQEAATIAEVLRAVHAALDAIGKSFEMILVSDGSTDGTERKAAALGLSELRVIQLPTNRGKGQALRLGFSEAVGSTIVFFDADRDLKPATLENLIRVQEQTLSDVVVGSKVHPDSIVVYPVTRRVMSRAFQILVRALFNLAVTDTQTGAKLFTRNVLEETIGTTSNAGFAFDLELMIRIQDAGFQITEAPIELDYAFQSSVAPADVASMLRAVVELSTTRRASKRRLLGSSGQYGSCSSGKRRRHR